MRASRATKTSAQRHSGQDQVAQERPQPVADRGEALHRQPVELQREHIGQQIADHEHRHGEAEHRQHHHRRGRSRSRASMPPARRAGSRHHDGEHDGQDHQRQRRFDALRDHVADRQIGEDRVAEVAVHDLPQPFAEAHQERPVQSERGTDTLHVGGRGLVARDDRGRIAGREIEQAEHEERDDEHHRDGGKDASCGVGKHVGDIPRSALGHIPQNREWRLHHTGNMSAPGLVAFEEVQSGQTSQNPSTPC